MERLSVFDWAAICLLILGVSASVLITTQGIGGDSKFEMMSDEACSVVRDTTKYNWCIYDGRVRDKGLVKACDKPEYSCERFGYYVDSEGLSKIVLPVEYLQGDTE